MAIGQRPGSVGAGEAVAAARAVTVSVIVPVWNVEPYLAQCLDSVLVQTIGLDQLEIIAVDDGSTDGSGALLDAYARLHPQLIAVHQPNSGGPGGPRNAGLDRATGTFVFFLDADDYLGPEALERMVAMAERHGTDIVLGRLVGVDGRPVPSQAFSRTVGRAKVEDVYSTLLVFKLFRRSLLERLGLRFPVGLARGEDSDFTARAYFGADGISVVADYDCYYFRDRPDSQTRSRREYDLVAHMHRAGERIEQVVRSSRPGPGRDRMVARLVRDHVVRVFGPRWLELEPGVRREAFELGAALLARWSDPRALRRLPPWLAVRAYCLGHGLVAELEDVAGTPPDVAFGDPVIDGHRLFARYPHFRDRSGIPDRCFEITSRVDVRQAEVRARVADGILHVSGVAYLTLIGGSTTVVLRRWPRGPELAFPVETVATPSLRDSQWVKRHHRSAGFEVVIDLATAASGRPLDRGAWDVWLRVGTGDVQRSRPLLAARGARIAPGDGLYVARSRQVRLRVGRAPAGIGLLERAEAVWELAVRAARRARRAVSARI